MAKKKAATSSKKLSATEKKKVHHEVENSVQEFVGKSESPIPVSLVQQLVKGKFDFQLEASEAMVALNDIVLRANSGESGIGVVIVNGIPYLSAILQTPAVTELVATATRNVANSGEAVKAAGTNVSLRDRVAAAMVASLSGVQGRCMSLRSLRAEIGNMFRQNEDLAELIAFNLAFNDARFVTHDGPPVTTCLA